MEGRCSAVLSSLRESLTTRDGPLLVATAIGGTYNVTGPRRVNGAAICKLTADAGLKWSVTFGTAKGRPSLNLSPAQQWVAPTMTVSGNGANAVSNWVAQLPNTRCAQQRLAARESGCVQVLKFQAEGSLDSTAVNEVLRVPSVVNVFVFADAFEVWLARPSTASGSLEHLATTNRISSRLAPRKAVKRTARRHRKRRKMKR
ncbi:MAG: hypothetical protein ACPGR8_12930 [Limisphaerales bacterium]